MRVTLVCIRFNCFNYFLVKRILLIALAAMLVPFALLAQSTIRGTVSDKASGSVLPGASVHIGAVHVMTDAGGRFLAAGLKKGTHEVRVSFIGYKTLSRIITVNGDKTLDLQLNSDAFLADEVIVRGTRASENTASTYKNMSRKDIEKYNIGQDIPYIINQTPSVVVTSDAGAGIGYTGMRIRGSDAQRINVTVNGIPLNDAESQGSFFVNLPDFASSLDNIQIQRGLGTSTNGAGAFGGSLNLQTTTRRDSAYAELNNSFGSYKSIKNTVSIGTGLINDHFTFDGRLSQIRSDGYVDRASSALKSFFTSAAYYGKNDLVRLNVFSGKEKTYQSWYGVPQSMLETDRTYNYYTYEDQTDNYQQDHYQLHYSHNFSQLLTLNTALHYTYGRGYYEEFNEDDSLNVYNISSPVINGQPVHTADIVRRRWLRNHFYGMTYSLIYNPKSDLNFILGGAYNEYRGKHFGEVIWADVPYVSQTPGYTSLRQRYYDNDAVKKDFNSYLRTNYQINDVSLFADLQYRRVDYSFLGYDRNQNNVQQQAAFNFFNPKLGLTWFISPTDNVYASWALGHKEPNRDDFTESSPDSRPRPEKLHDVEAGYRSKGLNYTIGANFYAMIYKDQLVSTGKINDVGAYPRQNVANSYRMGLELDGQWRILSNLSWAATATLSRNKIKAFDEYIDLGTTQQRFSYKNTDISFSPNIIASSELSYRFMSKAEIAFLSKYVGSQFLDNTSNGKQTIDAPDNRDRKIDAFFVNDLRLRFNSRLGAIRDLGIAFQVNNIFSELYESNGYTYRYIDGGTLYSENSYYPQAPRNFMLSLNIKF